MTMNLAHLFALGLLLCTAVNGAPQYGIFGGGRGGQYQGSEGSASAKSQSFGNDLNNGGLFGNTNGGTSRQLGFGNQYNPYQQQQQLQQQYAGFVQQGIQQGANFVSQIAGSILGQRPGLNVGFVQPQFGNNGFNNQGFGQQRPPPNNHPNQGGNVPHNQKPNHGQNNQNHGNNLNHNQNKPNQGQISGGIPPPINNQQKPNQGQISGGIPPPINNQQTPNQGQISGGIPPPINNQQNPNQGQTSGGIPPPINKPVDPAPTPAPQSIGSVDPSDADLDSLLSILDQESNKGKESDVTPSANSNGFDYDFDVRVDEKDKIERARRSAKEVSSLPDTKPAEETEIDSRFLGEFGKKALNFGANALRTGASTAKSALQGGFHFPTEENNGFVPAHLKPPPKKQGQKPNQNQPLPNQQGNKQPLPNQQVPNPPQSILQSGGASNAQGQAQNQGAGSNQNAGANTHSSNVQNELGSFQNTGGSSIAANLANDGSGGQLSAANTQQSSSLTAEGLKETNSAQSQSANFDKQGNLQASNAGTNVNVIKEKDRERVETMGTASSVNKNQFGTSQSGANTNTVQFSENGVQGSQSTSQGQSTHIGNDGSMSGSNANAGTQQWTGPGGIQGTSSSAQSSSQNSGGSGGSGSGASAGSGSTGSGSGSFANSGSFGGNFGGNFGGSNAGASSGSGGGGGGSGSNAGASAGSGSGGGGGGSGSNAGASAGSGGIGGGSVASASSSAFTNTGSFGHPFGQTFSSAGSQSFSMSGSVPHGADIGKIPNNFNFPG